MQQPDFVAAFMLTAGNWIDGVALVFSFFRISVNKNPKQIIKESCGNNIEGILTFLKIVFRKMMRAYPLGAGSVYRSNFLPPPEYITSCIRNSEKRSLARASWDYAAVLKKTKQKHTLDDVGVNLRNIFHILSCIQSFKILILLTIRIYFTFLTTSGCFSAINLTKKHFFFNFKFENLEADAHDSWFLFPSPLRQQRHAWRVAGWISLVKLMRDWWREPTLVGGDKF